MNSNTEENLLALRAKSTGDYFYENNNIGKAFANYLLALNIRRDWREELKDIFSQILCDWGNTLEEAERFSDLFTCYEEALKIYPDSAVILNNLGAHLIRLNHVKEASQYFIQSLSADPLYLPARRNLENVSNRLVQRWHFRMLNDVNRNNSYRRAIHSVVKEGDVVLDIGTGTGLLSLFAAECNPEMVFACDYSEVMTSLATDIIEKNGFENKIRVINKCSDHLQIPTDMTKRANILVTEIMDAGLFGEGLLQSLDDAYDRLLTSSTSNPPTIVPKSAVLYIAPIECLHLARKFKHIKDCRVECSVDFEYDLQGDVTEPYDCDDLKSLNVKYLSEPKEILSINFNSSSDVKNILANKNDINLTINCSESGYLDALAVWFQCNLSETEFISTSPLSKVESCWDQAVFQISKNITVDKDSQIEICLSSTAGKLSLINYNVNSSVPRFNKSFKVSLDFIKFLNSHSCINQYDLFLSELKKLNEPLDILELSIYPYVGLKLVESKKGKLVSFLLSTSDKDLILSQMGSDVKEVCDFYLMDCAVDFFKQRLKFDVIVLEPLNTQGELNDALITIYPCLRDSMKPDCIIFPKQVRFHCQLVYSKWLEDNTSLNNRSLLEEFKDFESLNDFKVNRFVDININRLKFREMSEELVVGQLDLDGIFSSNLQEFTVTTKASSSGKINAVLNWFSYGNDFFVSTKSEDFHRNQGAEIFQLLNVQKGDNLLIKLNYMSCILKFDVSVI